MKTSEALFEAVESVSLVHQAMFDDMNDPDTKPAGVEWIQKYYPIITDAYQILSDARNSYNDHERGEG
jgi:hypothetical protein